MEGTAPRVSQAWLAASDASVTIPPGGGQSVKSEGWPLSSYRLRWLGSDVFGSGRTNGSGWVRGPLVRSDLTAFVVPFVWVAECDCWK